MKNRTKLPNIYIGVVTAVLYLPIVLVIIYSFNESKISSVWGGFSLKWYETLFRDAAMFEALGNSIVLALCASLGAAVIGTLGAILFPMDDITGFLYLIGSVFAPMIAVQIADHFILRRDRFAVADDARNLVIWLVGFLAYRLLMGVDTPVGYTLPAMVLTVLLCILAEKIKPTVKA